MRTMLPAFDAGVGFQSRTRAYLLAPSNPAWTGAWMRFQWTRSALCWLSGNREQTT
jgi:hypothetical protein